MQLYREENIRTLLAALEQDQYDDVAQDETVGIDEVPPDAHAFLSLYLGQRTPVLEIGCGGGSLFGRYGITHGVEPARRRHEAAQARGAVMGVAVERGVAECLPYPSHTFSAALMLNGFFQVRSDYEALVEINRVLRPGGVFIFNLLTEDATDVVCGRCYGPLNTRRVLEQFGFDTVGFLPTDAGPRFAPYPQTSTYLAAQKVRDFDARWLNLPQVKRAEDVVNFLPDRDWRLL